MKIAVSKLGSLYLSLGILLAGSVTQAATAAEAFSKESQWMLGDWNGQRTALQQQGYDFSFGYGGEPLY